MNSTNRDYIYIHIVLQDYTWVDYPNEEQAVSDGVFKDIYAARYYLAYYLRSGLCDELRKIKEVSIRHGDEVLEIYSPKELRLKEKRIRKALDPSDSREKKLYWLQNHWD